MSQSPQARLGGELAKLSNLGIRPGLERFEKAARALGNPQSSFPAILIGGTNGKGSVATLLETAFRLCGYKTGLYTSPHLVHYTERIRISGDEINPDDMRQTLQSVLAASREARTSLTQFEALTLTAFLVLARERVDIAIMEVGMGGRWDATNSLTRVLASAITNVDLDHTEWLGNTLRKIAKEKAGILRPGVPTVTAASGAALDIIEKTARRRGSPLYRYGTEFFSESGTAQWPQRRQQFSFMNGSTRSFTLGLLGTHQHQNAAVALKTLGLMEKAGYHLPDTAQRKALRNARWPGRLEFLEYGRRRFLVDGAHNPAGAGVLSESLLRSPWGKKPLTILFGCMKDKDTSSMIRQLSPRAGRVLTVGLPSSRAASPAILRELWRPYAPATAFKNIREALKNLPEGNDPIIATGSLYLVGILKSLCSTPSLS